MRDGEPGTLGRVKRSVRESVERPGPKVKLPHLGDEAGGNSFNRTLLVRGTVGLENFPVLLLHRRRQAPYFIEVPDLVHEVPGKHYAAEIVPMVVNLFAFRVRDFWQPEVHPINVAKF